MSKRLGTDKELEKLARRVRRAGGSVQITGSSHLLWELDGRSARTGRTMHPSGVVLRVRQLERELGLIPQQPGRGDREQLPSP